MNDRSRTVIAAGIAVLVGILALPFVFGDPTPDEAVARQVAVAAGIFLLGGVLVGWIARGRWPISALCAWTPIGLGFVMLFSKLAVEAQVPYWSAIVAFLLGPLAVAVVGGYVGFRLVDRIASPQH